MFVGRPSQCISRMIQDFLTHGIDPWFFIVHGICPWFWTHSHFRVFWYFLGEWGLCCNKFQTSMYLWGKEYDILDQFWWNLIVKVRMEEIMVGLPCIIMVSTIEIYAEIFFVNRFPYDV